MLFLSERPLGELADERVVAVRPWFRAGGAARRPRGTSVLVRASPPVSRPVTHATAVVGAADVPGALLTLPLSPRGALTLTKPEP